MEGFKGNEYAFGELWGQGREIHCPSSLGLPNPPFWKLQLCTLTPSQPPPSPGLYCLAVSTGVHVPAVMAPKSLVTPLGQPHTPNSQLAAQQ